MKNALALVGFVKSNVTCPTAPVVKRVHAGSGTVKSGVKKIIWALVDAALRNVNSTVLVFGKVGGLMVSCANTDIGKAICAAKKMHRICEKTFSFFIFNLRLWLEASFSR